MLIAFSVNFFMAFWSDDVDVVNVKNSAALRNEILVVDFELYRLSYPL